MYVYEKHEAPRLSWKSELKNHRLYTLNILRTMSTILALLPWMAAVGLLGGIYYVWYRVFSYQGIPTSLAFANSDGSFFSRGRASLGSVFEVNTLLWAGHRDVRISLFILIQLTD